MEPIYLFRTWHDNSRKYLDLFLIHEIEGMRREIKLFSVFGILKEKKYFREKRENRKKLILSLLQGNHFLYLLHWESKRKESIILKKEKIGGKPLLLENYFPYLLFCIYYINLTLITLLLLLK